MFKVYDGIEDLKKCLWIKLLLLTTNTESVLYSHQQQRQKSQKTNKAEGERKDGKSKK